MMTIGKSGHFASSVWRVRGAKGGSMTSQKIDRLEIRKDEGQRRNCNAANNESRENRSWINVANCAIPPRSSFEIGRSDDRGGEKLALRSLANAGKNTLTRSLPKILTTNANDFRSRCESYTFASTTMFLEFERDARKNDRQRFYVNFLFKRRRSFRLLG